MAKSRPNPMDRTAVTYTATQFFGRPLEISECAAVLSRMSLESVVGRLALLRHVNDGVFSDPDPSTGEVQRYTRRSIEFLFDEGRQDLAREQAMSDDKFRPVSDQALQATFELAVLCCPRDDLHWINGDPLRIELTHVILSFQEVLFSRAFQVRLGRVANENPGNWGVVGQDAWQEMIRNRMAHNIGKYYRRALGRLYAMCRNPEIDAMVQKRASGKSVTTMFSETFGLSPEEYLGSAFLSVAPGFGMDLTAPDAIKCFYRPETYWNLIAEPYRGKIRDLMALATRPANEPEQMPAISLDDFLYHACQAHVQPVLDLGNAALCFSPHLLMNKFVVGLPYLAQEMAIKRAAPRVLSPREIGGVRAPFGILFECYVVWLFRKLLQGWTGTEIVAPMWCGPTKEYGECDLVVIRRDTAYVFEIKTTLATLVFRRTGSFVGLDAVLLEGAKQAYRAALALRASLAVRASDGKPIEDIRFVVPCVITYEDIPLYHPISDFYEEHLADVTKLPLFKSADGIESLQFFDVDFLESWESNFDLSPNSGAPFAYLLQRARNPFIRHDSIQSGVAHPRLPEAPTPYDDNINESRAYLEMLARSWRQPSEEAPAASPPAC